MRARTGPVTGARRRRRVRLATVSVGLAAACAGVVLVSLAVGAVTVPLAEVVRALSSAGAADGGYTVYQLRLPRALVAVLAGAAFGISGSIFQNLLRNPLASPDIIGISAGASAAAATALLVFQLRGYAVSAAAFAGALGTAAAIYALAWRRGVTGYRLVLVGIALAAMLTSAVSYLLTRADVYDARQALIWLTGSLNAKTWESVQTLGAGVAALVPLALLAGRWLRALQLGDEAARALGVPVERARLALLVLAVALCAVATAAVGPVAFVAFVAGPIARRLPGGSPTALVPAGLVGALVTTTSDTLARNAVPSAELPVGVVTAMVGAPYLLWLLAVTNRAGRG